MSGRAQIDGAEGTGTAPEPAVAPSAAVESSESAHDELVRARRSRKLMFALLFVVAAVTILSYSTVLCDFFVGDDYVHLTWLKQAVVNPELVWKNFHSSWLDGVTTKFYRPLISVFMYTDYLIWRSNGIGFHITNLVFHLIATFALFGVVSQLRRATEPTDNSQPDRHLDFWALAAAMLFGLYPLHPEAVAWITGRVDTIVTAFTLLSLWCYMRWRNGCSKVSAVASAGFLTLALLSKEMAVTLPAVFIVVEVTRWLSARTGSTDPPSATTHSWRALLRSSFHTLPFWMVVAVYFAVRRIALGTFVGGYDDSLFFIADIKGFIAGWAHALRMVVIPINSEILPTRSPLGMSWHILLATAAALSLWTAARNRAVRWQLFFLVSWFALALVPVYKIFAIADDLQGSRLAYLATAPLCAAIVLMLSHVGPLTGKSRIAGRLKVAITVALMIVAGAVLFLNNVPWMLAGLESNRIRDALDDLYSDVINGDPEVLLVGLPDTTFGAYTCRNALQGMTQTPQFSRDLQHVIAINAFEPILPFGFLKESMAVEPHPVRVFRWNSEKGSFDPQPIPKAQLESDIDLSVSDKESPKPAQMRTRDRLYEVEPLPSLPCWSMEFVEVAVNADPPGPLQADLFYANTSDPNIELKRRSHAEDAGTGREHKLIFPLRGLPDWSLGGRALKMQLGLPAKGTFHVQSIKVVPPRTIMPFLSFSNSGYLGTKGYLHLGKDAPEATVKVDFSGITGAVAADAEITRANLLFEEQNCTQQSKVQGMLVPFSGDAAAKTGELTLKLDQFKTPGIYELRAWAKNSQGQPSGVASDHIVIAVDP